MEYRCGHCHSGLPHANVGRCPHCGVRLVGVKDESAPSPFTLRNLALLPVRLAVLGVVGVLILAATGVLVYCLLVLPLRLLEKGVESLDARNRQAVDRRRLEANMAAAGEVSFDQFLSRLWREQEEVVFKYRPVPAQEVADLPERFTYLEGGEVRELEIQKDATVAVRVVLSWAGRLEREVVVVFDDPQKFAQVGMGEGPDRRPTCPLWAEEAASQERENLWRASRLAGELLERQGKDRPEIVRGPVPNRTCRLILPFGGLIEEAAVLHVVYTGRDDPTKKWDDYILVYGRAFRSPSGRGHLTPEQRDRLFAPPDLRRSQR